MNSLFGDWKWKNPFATIQRPNPQDFITPGAVTTPGVSVNPHSGLGYFEFGDGTILPENIETGMKTGDFLSTPQIMDKVDLLNDEFRWTKGADPKDQFEYFGDGNWGLKSDAPTYEKREKDTFDEKGYKELKEEYDKQQQILAAQRQQFAELAAGGGTPQPRGAGSVNVGSRGPIQINPLNPVAQIKQPEILTGPFLGRWRR